MARRDSADVIEVIPGAHRLVSSLRDIGYDFVQAVADVLDNSIAGRATRVDIVMKFDGARSWIRISDNGRGLSGADLTEAMRYGAVRDYEADDLSKFGLGLKTASMSQCRRLSVASRSDPNMRRIEARAFDLDYIEKTNKWHVLDLGPDERDEALVQPLQDHTGTVILWEKLDRVLDYKNPHGDWAKAAMLQLAEQLELHLGMVFHRFLAGEVIRKRKLSITINGAKVEAWDPFARSEKGTQAYPKHEVEVAGSSGKGLVSFRPFILPPKDKFSTPEAFERLSGPRKWNQQQGFYIYRADRMVQSGGWCNIRTPDEHTKLARCSIDFYPELDDAFEINVAKVRVKLPSDLRRRLEGQVENLCKRARIVYGRKPSFDEPSGKASPTNGNPGRGGTSSKESSIPASSQESHEEGSGSASRLRKVLEEAARKAGEDRAFARIIRILKKDAPEVAHDLGW